MDKLSSLAGSIPGANSLAGSIPGAEGGSGLKLPEICAPVLIYFIFSIIIFFTAIILIILGQTQGGFGTQFMNLFVYLILVIMFCLFLYKLCKLEYNKAAWFFAILPFLFIFLRIILFIMVALSPPP